MQSTCIKRRQKSKQNWKSSRVQVLMWNTAQDAKSELHLEYFLYFCLLLSHRYLIALNADFLVQSTNFLIFYKKSFEKKLWAARNVLTKTAKERNLQVSSCDISKPCCWVQSSDLGVSPFQARWDLAILAWFLLLGSALSVGSSPGVAEFAVWEIRWQKVGESQ